MIVNLVFPLKGKVVHDELLIKDQISTVCSMPYNYAVFEFLRSGGSMLGPGGHSPPPQSCPGPPNFQGNYTVHKLLNTGQLLDTVVLPVVASQMMRGQAPQIYFPRTAPVSRLYFTLYFITSISSLL